MRQLGKSYYQKLAMEQALDEGRTVVVLGKDGVKDIRGSKSEMINITPSSKEIKKHGS